MTTKETAPKKCKSCGFVGPHGMVCPGQCRHKMLASACRECFPDVFLERDELAAKLAKSEYVYTEYTTQDGLTESETYTFDQAAERINELRFRAEAAEAQVAVLQRMSFAATNLADFAMAYFKSDPAREAFADLLDAYALAKIATEKGGG